MVSSKRKRTNDRPTGRPDVDPVTMVMMARTTPNLLEYIQGRRARGIRPEGTMSWLD